MSGDKIFIKKVELPLGEIIIGSKNESICFLQFFYPGFQKNLEKKFKANLVLSDNMDILNEAQKQLQEYFEKKRKDFKLPITLKGTDFQKKCWEALLKIPYGETISYSKQAEMVGNPKAVRAVANANRLNPIAIIVPCHRVIGKNGRLTGYAGGLDKKEFLLKLEKK